MGEGGGGMGVGVVPATRVKAACPHSETDPQINKRCERQKVGLQQGHRSHARGARTTDCGIRHLYGVWTWKEWGWPERARKCVPTERTLSEKNRGKTLMSVLTDVRISG